MARGDYTPEIKSSMGGNLAKKPKTSPPKENPAEDAKDRKLGIKEGTAQDMKMDAPMPQHQQMPMQQMPMQAAGGQSPAHAAMAASIAHAILGRGGH